MIRTLFFGLVRLLEEPVAVAGEGRENCDQTSPQQEAWSPPEHKGPGLGALRVGALGFAATGL